MASKVLGISLAKQVLASKGMTSWIKPMAMKYADLCGFRKVGLKYDDIIIEENTPVQRALSRLPANEAYDRAYRLKVAINCSMLHHDLPKDQWLPADKDTRYLTPLVEEIANEEAERSMWDGATINRPKRGSKH